jgi:hypothetical protein
METLRNNTKMPRWKLVELFFEAMHQLLKLRRKFGFRNRVVNHVQLLAELAVQRRFDLFIPKSFETVHCG